MHDRVFSTRSGKLSSPPLLATIEHLGGAGVRAFLMAMAIALGGCASHSSAYSRTDGVPVDPLHQQATLAQCKGEAATAVVQTTGGAYGALDRARKEATLVDACMARNGYIQA
jgi:hypothetical protein